VARCPGPCNRLQPLARRHNPLADDPDRSRGRHVVVQALPPVSIVLRPLQVPAGVRSGCHADSHSPRLRGPPPVVRSSASHEPEEGVPSRERGTSGLALDATTASGAAFIAILAAMTTSNVAVSRC
jgi:hypothetical protein